jgi:hypothetical protein
LGEGGVCRKRDVEGGSEVIGGCGLQGYMLSSTLLLVPMM